MAALDPQNASWLTNQDAAVAPSPTAAPATPKPPKPSTPAAPEPPKPSAPAAPAPQGGGLDGALKSIGEIEQRRSEMMPPKLEMPQKQKTSNDDIQLWGALAIAFAGFASMRTRTPMTTAINAAAAAIQGMQQGQKERADQAYKEWKQQTDIALETASYEQRAYEEVMNNMTRREELALKVGEAQNTQKDKEDALKAKTLATAMDDPIMQQAHDQGMSEGGPSRAMELMAGVAKQREKDAQKLKEASTSVSQAYITKQNLDMLDQTPEYQAKIQSGDKMGALEMRMKIIAQGNPKQFAQLASVQGDPQSTQRMVDAVGNYQIAMPSGYLARTAFGQQVRDGVLQKYPDYSDANYKSVNKVTQDMAGGAGSLRVASMTMLMGHLQTLEKLADQLPNDADSQTMNAAMIAIARQFGNTDVSSYDQAKDAVSKEFTKVLVGTGAGGVSERQDAADQLSAAHTKDQLKAAIDTTKELVRSRVVSEMNRVSTWVKPERFFKPDVMQFYGITPGNAAGPSAKTPDVEPGPGPAKDVNLPSIGASVPKPQSATEQKTLQEAAHKQAPKGAVAMRQKPDGTWEYKDAQGKIIGQ